MPIEILEHRIAPAAFLVVTTADSGTGSLRNAIESANASTDATNSIIFANGLHGVIALKSALPAITVNLSIGGHTNSSIVISGRNEFQIFNVNGASAPVAVTLTDMTLAYGHSQSGGAVYVNDYMGTVKVVDCTITRNHAVGASGGTGSGGTGMGGGFDVVAGTLDITSSVVTGNVATGGSGASGGTGEGGGVYVTPGATLVVTAAKITGNIAQGGLGLPGTNGASGLPASAGTDGGSGGNGGNGEGGGIWSYGTVKTALSTISGNIAIGGRGGAGGNGGRGGAGSPGGAAGSGGAAGGGFGGGIYTEGTGILTVNTSTVSGNIAATAPGGRAGGRGPAGTRSTPGAAGFAGAELAGYGGGIHSAYSTISMEDSTVANNVADQGGGLFINANTSTLIANDTIAFNTAHQAGEGGGMWAYLDSNNDPVVVISTALGQNVTTHKGAGADLSISNGAVTASNSLVESYTVGAVTSADNNILDTSPLLDHLAKNGGLTLTCLPSSLKSPLLGNGSNPENLEYDQRGAYRVIGGTVDIGSVEIA